MDIELLNIVDAVRAVKIAAFQHEILRSDTAAAPRNGVYQTMRHGVSIEIEDVSRDCRPAADRATRPPRSADC